MSEPVIYRIDVPENHEHFWIPDPTRLVKTRVRCLRCELEALQIKGKIYRTWNQLQLNLRAGE